DAGCFSGLHQNKGPALSLSASARQTESPQAEPFGPSLRSRNHMKNSTVPSPAGKRGRNSSAILTDRMCEKRVAKRTKLYDRKCPGLYASITMAGVATFSFKFTDRQTGKQRTGWLGVYNPETFTVEDARSRVYGLKGMGGEALAETFRDQKAK